MVEISPEFLKAVTDEAVLVAFLLRPRWVVVLFEDTSTQPQWATCIEHSEEHFSLCSDGWYQVIRVRCAPS